MLIAVADLSATCTRLGLVDLHGTRRLVAGEPMVAEGDVLGELLTLLGRHRLRLPDVEGYAVCSNPDAACEGPLHLLQGLALSQRRPMIGLSRIRALAVASMGRVPVGTTLIPVLELSEGLRIAAFRQDVTGVLKELRAETDADLEALRALASSFGPAVGLGMGYRSHRAELEETLPPLDEAADTLDLTALGEASIVALRAARGQRSARKIFAINSPSAAADGPTAATVTEWR